MKPEIIIAGAGVSGLSTGIVFLQAGYKVKIVAREFSPNTTSDVAGAIWFPFQAEPKEKVLNWSKLSYQRFEAICEKPEAGVSLIELTLLSPKKLGKTPWWAKFISPDRIRKLSPSELPMSYEDGLIVLVPLIETQLYMQFLINWFERLGGISEKAEIKSLHSLLDKSRILINCTGLGAGQLAKDQEVFPIQGQIVKIEKIPDVFCISDDEGVNALSYIIPRQDCIVLGGTAVKGEPGLFPDHAISRSILEKCTRLEPKLSKAKVITSLVGLRPGRSSIRLEMDEETWIFHNYGHGGSGFTVSWGCAEEILSLVQHNNPVILPLK